MDRDRWLDLNRRGMEATFTTFARSAGARVIEREGVFGVVNVAAAERSVFNSVLYEPGAPLDRVREELAAAYAQAGCAWTVWVPAADTEAAAMLGRAGHVLDAEPRAMGADLAAVGKPDLGDLDWTDEGTMAEAGPLNDLAYGYEEGTWVRGTGPDPEGFVVYIAYLDGAPVSTVGAYDHGDDCSIWNVATLESMRGRGIATRLMQRALWDAARRGCRTSTLQATSLGAPIYARLGYTDLGPLQMWELRE